MTAVSVIVAYDDAALATDLVAEGLVDPDTVQDSDCEHGFESAAFAVDAAPHIRAHNALVADAPVKIIRSGKVTFEGTVVVIRDGVSPHEVECSGVWDKLTRDEAYCQGFVEGRYDLITEYPGDVYKTLYGNELCTTIELSTDGQVLAILPKGSSIKLGQGIAAYLWPLDGLDPGLRISRVTGTWTCAGAGEITMEITAVEPDPFDPTLANITLVAEAARVDSTAGDSGTFDSWTDGYLDAHDYKALVFSAYASADATNTSAENSIQLRSLKAYINRTTAPRPDQIIAGIACPADNSICLASDTEAIGSAVTQFMADPLTTRSQAIEQARALYSGIMDVGVWEDATVHVRARPTSPPDRSRWIALTMADLADPSRDWGIAADSEAGVDAICCTYSVTGDATYPDGTPQSVYYPSRPANADARVAVLDLGDATDAEALAAATQVYLYTSQLATGGVDLDAEHLTARYGLAAVPTVDGALLPIDQIRSWDWVMCVDAPDADSRGPWMLSRAERTAAGTTIEVGGDYWQHPGFAHRTDKTRYIGGHWKRTRYRKWAKGSKRPSGKGWRRKGKRWWKWAWRRRWVEGTYA